VQIQPYLFFEGRCEEALDFYRDQLGATIPPPKAVPAAHRPT
jgi:uncharacterized glyoxalase superfamily protein PhnB